MTFQEMICVSSNKRILKSLFELYPEEKASESAYKQVLKTLRKKESVSGSMYLVVDAHTDCGDNYIDVYGIDPHAEEDQFGKKGEEIAWAIEYKPWDEILGMEVVITDAAIDKGFVRNGFDTIAHILYEITFIDFDEESIIASFNEMKEKFATVEANIKELLEEIETNGNQKNDQ